MPATAALFNPSLVGLTRYRKVKLSNIERDDPQSHEVPVKISSGGHLLQKLVKFYPFKKINDTIRDGLSGKVVKAILKMGQALQPKS